MDLMFGSNEDVDFNNQAGGCSIAELGYGVKSLISDMLTWRHSLAFSG